MVTITLALLWFATGQGVALLMRWRGHGATWHVWGVVLGPLLHWVARDLRSPIAFTQRGVIAGRPGAGERDVLVVASARPDTTSQALWEVYRADDIRLGRVTVARIADLDDQVAWWHTTRPDIAQRRAIRSAELERPLRWAVWSRDRVPGIVVEPSAVLLFGRAAPSIEEYVAAHAYTDVVVADHGPAARALVGALADRLRGRATVRLAGVSRSLVCTG